MKEVVPNINENVDMYGIIQIAFYLQKNEDKMQLWNKKIEKLFDFTCNYKDAKEGKHFEQSIDLSVIGNRFAQPNYSGEEVYLATQYISEYVKHLKDKSGKNIFDGLCFKSSLDGKGYNYVLFDVLRPKYRIKNSSVYQVLDLVGNLQLQLPLLEENINGMIDCAFVKC